MGWYTKPYGLSPFAMVCGSGSTLDYRRSWMGRVEKWLFGRSSGRFPAIIKEALGRKTEGFLVEPRRVELLASCVQNRRSTN
jgi:hypothetical protein